jgi:hypothetical protein
MSQPHTHSFLRPLKLLYMSVRPSVGLTSQPTLEQHKLFLEILMLRGFIRHNIRILVKIVQNVTECLPVNMEFLCAQLKLNPFQSNFSATRILPSSYLFWAEKRLVGYL